MGWPAHLSLVRGGGVSPTLATFHQGGITSSLGFPFHNHIENNVEFGWGVS